MHDEIKVSVVEFGEPESDEGFPNVEKPEAKTTAGDLLAAFLGRE